jgi:iduronate 2-sulfatase
VTNALTIAGALAARRTPLLWIGWLALALFAALAAGTGCRAQTPRKPNVLLIIADDLRPDLGCYGNRDVRTPNIDRLAARGTLFNRAYCQYPLCSPSRSSFLTGKRPETTGIYNNRTHIRRTLPNVVTLPQYFKQNGYVSIGLHKIFHDGYDDRASWSVPHWDPSKKDGIVSFAEDERPAVEAVNVTDDQLPDGATAARAVKLLEQYRNEPFFMAVGFRRPHQPFTMPKRYWDLYNEATLRLPPNMEMPDDAPDFAAFSRSDVGRYTGLPKTGARNDAQGRELLHGYYACVSYVDAQVGRLLRSLDILGLRDNTIVVFWGDHGYQLGEHGMWASKETLYEISLRSPLIVSAPGQRAPGARTDGLVEAIDVYPSLAELAGLPPPRGVEASSFKPLMDDPGRSWKRAAFSEQIRTLGDRDKILGRSVRTDRYRLTEWDLPRGRREYELYDYQADPDERRNLANRREERSTVKDLTRLLHDGWLAARPPRS